LFQNQNFIFRDFNVLDLHGVSVTQLHGLRSVWFPDYKNDYKTENKKISF